MDIQVFPNNKPPLIPPYMRCYSILKLGVIHLGYMVAEEINILMCLLIKAFFNKASDSPLIRKPYPPLYVY